MASNNAKTGEQCNFSSDVPAQVSSASSLDTFLIDLPGEGDLVFQFVEYDNLNNHTDSKAVCQHTEENSADNENYAASSLGPSKLGLKESNSWQHLGLITSMLPESSSNNNAAMATIPPRAAAAAVSSTPEFLFQLTKMLTDDNFDVIEWSKGRIEVHNPHRLQSEVLNKYYRHSKFASFQRQLNYFGFRKIAGKGKMAPCSYVNEATGDDLSSILLIKRKVGPSTTTPKQDASSKKSRNRGGSVSSGSGSVNNNNETIQSSSLPLSKPRAFGTTSSHVSNSTKPELITTASNENKISNLSAHQIMARRAVGKGIRHGFAAASQAKGQSRVIQSKSINNTQDANLTTLQSNADSLAELANNYRNSLNALNQTTQDSTTDADSVSRSHTPNLASVDCFGFLSRNSSLIDLAMLAPLDDNDAGDHGGLQTDTKGFSFVDFPNPEVHPYQKAKADEEHCKE